MTGAVASRTRIPRARYWILLFALLLLVAAIILPPLVNINRYQRKIADSLSQAVGRPVHMSTVQLRLLPRPGFEIEDLVISEDPAFGSEPMLHSASVVAYIRLISLWRGRLEIARVSFDEPSLNLVRNSEGRWNVGSVLLQASRIPNAPTAQRHAGGTPRFPYIEASNARINFKFGNVKKPFSFLNADLSVWLDQPDQWQLRFEAQPARTDLDLNLADTGLFQLNGSLHRSSRSLGEMPVNLQAEWSNAPLGELSLLLLGDDSGWRGMLDVRADISGTPNDARFTTRLRASGVHRLEFEPPQRLEFETTCQGNWQRTLRSMRELTCFSPTGDGHLLLTGEIGELPDHPLPNLKLQFQHLPMASLLTGIRVVRAGFAPTVAATGTLDGEFMYKTVPASPFTSIQGQATVTGLTLSVPGAARPISFPAFPISTPTTTPPLVEGHSKHRVKPPAPPPLQEPALIVPAVSIGMGAAAPLTFNARLTAKEFELHLTGASTVDRMVSLSKAFGTFAVPFNSLAPQGTADLQLGIEGGWLLPVPDPERPVSTANVTGTVRLHNASVSPGFLASPLEIVAAQGTFSPNQVAWSPVSVTYGKMHADGSLTQPLLCANSTGCSTAFDIHVDSLSAAELQSTLLGGKHGQVLEQILARLSGPSHSWPAMKGKIRVNTFSFETLNLEDAVAELTVKGNQLTVTSFDSRALGGTLHLTGSLDGSGDLPVYAMQAEITHADPAAVAAMFDEKWGSGSLNVSTELHLTGFTAEKLASSAEGKFHWDWIRGSLPVDEDGLPSLAPMARFDRWTADGLVHGSQLGLTRSLLVHGISNLPLAGTVSFDRELQIHSDDPDRPLAIEGTLERPRLAVPAKTPKPKPAVFRSR
jgi:hypothetical protein